jgi:hypothetical protein
MMQPVIVGENRKRSERSLRITIHYTIKHLIHAQPEIGVGIALNFNVYQKPHFLPILQPDLQELIRMAKPGFRLRRKLFQLFVQKFNGAKKVNVPGIFRKKEIEQVLRQIFNDAFPKRVAGYHQVMFLNKTPPHSENYSQPNQAFDEKEHESRHSEAHQPPAQRACRNVSRSVFDGLIECGYFLIFLHDAILNLKNSHIKRFNRRIVGSFYSH